MHSNLKNALLRPESLQRMAYVKFFVSTRIETVLL